MEQNKVYTFLFECDWYAQWEDKEIHSQGIVTARTYGEAADAIANRFPDANNIFLDMYDNTSFIFLNKTLFNKMRDPENDWGLDFAEDEPIINED